MTVDGLRHQYATFRPAGKKYPGSVRVGGVLLTSFNMLQHPSATRSIASLGRSIPMPVRHYPPAPSISSPLPPISYTLAPPILLHHRPTTHSLPCFLPPTLRVTSVADRPQPSRFTPIANPRSPRSTSAVAATVVGSK